MPRSCPCSAPALVLAAAACQPVEDAVQRVADGLRGDPPAVESTWSPTSTEPPPPAPPPPGSWVEVDSVPDGFRAAFPEAPKTETMPTPTAIGNIDQKMFTVTRGDVYFAVSVAEYPAELVAGSDPDAMLDGARDGAVANVSGSLASETRVEVDGRPGRRIRITASVQGQPLELDGQLTIDRNRLYQALVAYPAAQRPGDVERFIGSFGLLEAR